MITVLPISKKENTSKVYVVSDLSDVSSLGFNEAEFDYLNGSLKDDFSGN